MPKRTRQAAAPPPADASTRDVTILLCSADAALREAWAKVAAPPHFCLQTEPELRPEHLASGRAWLVLADAETAAEAPRALAQALDAAADRFSYTGDFTAGRDESMMVMVYAGATPWPPKRVHKQGAAR